MFRYFKREIFFFNRRVFSYEMKLKIGGSSFFSRVYVFKKFLTKISIENLCGEI